MRAPGRRQGGAGLWGLWCLVVLGLGRPALALEPQRLISQYNHEAWRSENGLPQNSALALQHTADGYLWVGTYEGLARFDGARFTVYDKRSVPELKAHTINALAEDASGVLWVGASQGLLRYEGGQLRRWAQEGDLAQGPVHVLAASSQYLWIGSPLGLDRVSLSGTSPRRRYTVADGLPAGNVATMSTRRTCRWCRAANLGWRRCSSTSSPDTQVTFAVFPSG